MTKVYHYVRKHCTQTNVDVVAKIKEDGVIKCELDVYAERNDNCDSSLVWLTTDNNIVCGGANNHLLNITKKFIECAVEGSLEQRLRAGCDMFNRSIANIENFETNFEVYEFDAETINAISWNKYKQQKGKLSAIFRNYAEQIDAYSVANGDNIDDYYVCENAIDIKLATNVYSVKQTVADTLNAYDLEGFYQIGRLVAEHWNWFKQKNLTKPKKAKKAVLDLLRACGSYYDYAKFCKRNKLVA